MYDKKKMKDIKLNVPILSGGIITVAALRMLMAPLPNIEPVMLFTLTAGLAGGPIAGFLMGALTMIVSNILMSSGGLTFPWLLQMPLVTIYTSLAYGLVGAAAGLLGLFKKDWKRVDLTILAAGLTIFYDLVTCICFALQFYGPAGIGTALIAQVPFTVLHLTNAVFAFLFAPFLLKAGVAAKTFSIRGLLKNVKYEL